LPFRTTTLIAHGAGSVAAADAAAEGFLEAETGEREDAAPTQGEDVEHERQQHDNEGEQAAGEETDILILQKGGLPEDFDRAAVRRRVHAAAEAVHHEFINPHRQDKDVGQDGEGDADLNEVNLKGGNTHAVSGPAPHPVEDQPRQQTDHGEAADRLDPVHESVRQVLQAKRVAFQRQDGKHERYP